MQRKPSQMVRNAPKGFFGVIEHFSAGWGACGLDGFGLVVKAQVRSFLYTLRTRILMGRCLYLRFSESWAQVSLWVHP